MNDDHDLLDEKLRRKKDYQREYYYAPGGKEHREQWLEKKNPGYYKDWRKNHPTYQKEKRRKNQKHIQAYSRRWRAENPDYHRTYRKENIEEMRTYWRIYKRKQHQKSKSNK
jgi:hypothetical protein